MFFFSHCNTGSQNICGTAHADCHSFLCVQLNITVINRDGENEVKCVNLEEEFQMCSYRKHCKKKQICYKKNTSGLDTEHIRRSPTQSNHLLVKAAPSLAIFLISGNRDEIRLWHITLFTCCCCR